MERKNARNVLNRRAAVTVGVLTLVLTGGAAGAPRSPSPAAGSEAARKLLNKSHIQLLKEKGICDDQGREIRGRLGALFAESEGLGFDSSLGTVQFVLSRLNYRPKDLAGFSACAFDRPLGEKFLEYGHAFPVYEALLKQ